MFSRFLSVALIFPLLGCQLLGQELFRMNNVPVFHGTRQLQNPFTGGMNSCLVNQIDLNNDKIKDLVVVHQVGVSAGRIQPYIQKANGDYIYAPRYEAFFPKKGHYIFTLHDLNEDSTEDLILQTESYFLIYYSKRTNDTTFQFDFYDSVEFTSYDPLYGRQQLLGLNKYLPVFEDLDSDGDKEIVYVNRTGNLLWYYKNYKKELALPANENMWKSDNKYYGLFCFADFYPLKIKSGCFTSMMKGMTPPQKEPILTPRHDEYQMFWNIDVDGNKLYDLVVYSENQKNAPLGLNLGTKDSAYIVQDDIYFPSYSAKPINLMMPIGFWHDLNNDKAKDIAVSFLIERDFSGVQVTQKLFNDDIKTIHLYKNVGKRKIFNTKSATFHDSFAYGGDDFLSNETIDVGTGSAPVFYNYDKDSLVDLLIPNILKRDSWEIAYITYYRNIGNKKQPIYKLEDNDLLKYKSKNRGNIKIAVGDLNGDKEDDILITSFDRNLSGAFATNSNVPIIGEMYFHQKGSGGAFIYTTQSLNLEFEDKFGRTNICLHDIDKDGKTDMLMGDLFKLKYYRNTGTTAVPQFLTPTCDSVINPEDLIDPIYLPYPFLFHPAVWKDPKDNKEYLIFAYDRYHAKVGKALIDTQKLNNNRSLIVKMENKNLYPNYTINQDPAISIKDVTDDGKEEIIFGNYAGGVQMFSIDSLTGLKDPPPPPVSIATANKSMDFTVFPNPSSEKLYVEGLDKTKVYTIYIFSIEGRLIQSSVNFNCDMTLDITHLNHGVYWLNIVNEDLGSKTIKFQKN